MRSQVLSGAIQEDNHFTSIFSDGSYVQFPFEVWCKLLLLEVKWQELLSLIQHILQYFFVELVHTKQCKFIAVWFNDTKFSIADKDIENRIISAWNSFA